MSTRPLSLTALALAVLTLAPGCADTESCQKFAEHLAEVVAKEKPDAKISPESREKMIKNTTETCVADKVKPEALDCALKAQTSAAIKACDEQAGPS